MQKQRPDSGDEALSVDREHDESVCSEVSAVSSTGVATNAAMASAEGSPDTSPRLRWRLVPNEAASCGAQELTFRVATQAAHEACAAAQRHG